jgi:hypothetical protein
MFLKEPASLGFFCILHGVRFVRFHMCFPVLFSRFVLLFLACVFICLSFRAVCLFAAYFSH